MRIKRKPKGFHQRRHCPNKLGPRQNPRSAEFKLKYAGSLMGKALWPRSAVSGGTHGDGGGPAGSLAISDPRSGTRSSPPPYFWHEGKAYNSDPCLRHERRLDPTRHNPISICGIAIVGLGALKGAAHWPTTRRRGRVGYHGECRRARAFGPLARPCSV